MGRIQKWIGAMVAAALLLSGCGQDAGEKTAGLTLKYWLLMDDRMEPMYDNFGQTPLAQELEKETGVHIEYIHPRGLSSVIQELTLLKMAGSYPDIVESSWYSYPGGPEAAIQDGYILPLNEIMEQDAPHLKQFLQQNPDIDKMVKTDEGNYYVFPFIRGAEELCYPSGPMLRSDWLAQCNLGVPATIEDWHAVLTAFRQRFGCAAPLTIRPEDFEYGAFVGAWGETMDYYQINGQPVYGPSRPGYRAFLEEMAKWYQEGLIDPFFGTTGKEGIDINMLSGRSGATVGLGGGDMGKWIATAETEGFDLVAVPYPSLASGEKSAFGRKDWFYPSSFSYGSAGITPVCRNVEAAAKFLDYGYSQQGMMLYNFGIQGESYELLEGSPHYSNIITDNPQGYDMGTAMISYVRAHYSGPFIQMKEYQNQYYRLPGQKNAVDVWSQTEVDRYRMPLITFSKEESERIADKMERIDAIAREMTVNLIIGAQPLGQFDAYVEQMHKAGLQEVLDAYQHALQRYQGR